MKAILMDDFGGSDVLYLGEAERPSPASDQVLLEVAGVGVNRADLLQREGRYPPPAGESERLGLEVSGTVAELGAEVSDWQIGDRVMTILGGGGYAEYVAVPASTLMPAPSGLDLVSAAAIPEVFTTAYLNLFLEGQLTGGERVLIHGGGSGVGTAAIQLAKRLAEAEVFVTVGNRDKAERCRGLGADQAIVYKEEDFSQRVAELTDKRGVDVILDHIGGGYLDANLQSLSVGGRLVVIGLLGGRAGELDMGRLLVKRLRVVGSALRGRPLSEKAELTRQMARHVIPLFDDARLEPVIDRVMPLSEAAQAHERMAANENFGKILLAVS